MHPCEHSYRRRGIDLEETFNKDGGFRIVEHASGAPFYAGSPGIDRPYLPHQVAMSFRRKPKEIDAPFGCVEFNNGNEEIVLCSRTRLLMRKVITAREDILAQAQCFELSRGAA